MKEEDSEQQTQVKDHFRERLTLGRETGYQESDIVNVVWGLAGKALLRDGI